MEKLRGQSSSSARAARYFFPFSSSLRYSVAMLMPSTLGGFFPHAFVFREGGVDVFALLLLDELIERLPDRQPILRFASSRLP